MVAQVVWAAWPLVEFVDDLMYFWLKTTRGIAAASVQQLHFTCVDMCVRALIFFSSTSSLCVCLCVRGVVIDIWVTSGQQPNPIISFLQPPIAWCSQDVRSHKKHSGFDRFQMIQLPRIIMEFWPCWTWLTTPYLILDHQPSKEDSQLRGEVLEPPTLYSSQIKTAERKHMPLKVINCFTFHTMVQTQASQQVSETLLPNCCTWCLAIGGWWWMWFSMGPELTGTVTERGREMEKERVFACLIPSLMLPF